MLQEKKKYRNIWQNENYRRHSPGERLVDSFIESMDMPNGSSVIDFGCGTGRAAQILKNKGYEVTGIDIASNCLDSDVDINFTQASLWELPEIKADYGYCTDVMEHIPTEHVDKTLGCLAKSVDEIYFNIDLESDKRNGIEYHLTIKSISWWMDVISDYFAISDVYPLDRSVVILCNKRN